MSDLELTAEQQGKLAALKAISRPQVVEVVEVRWPAPDGAKFYAAMQLDEHFPNIPFSPIETRIPVQDETSFFQDILVDTGVSDDEVEIEFEDLDGEMSRLFWDYGEGIRCEIYYYFPQVDLAISVFWGLMRPPEEADATSFKASIAVGFRSPLLPLPRRSPGFAGCQAIFGALLKTAEEVAENDCPYDRHLEGGTFGNLDSEGQPFRSCPRNRPACIERLGDTLSYLGSDSVKVQHIVRQSRGGSRIASSRGNESNLKRPIRVIAGRRPVYDLDVLTYLAEPNTAHPDEGSVGVLYEVCEGPNDYLQSAAMDGVPVAPEHLNLRSGELRQAPTSFAPDVSNYSGTALMLGVTQGDFENVDAGGLPAGSVFVQGFKNVRSYTSPTEYYQGYTTSRAWWLLEQYTNKRWGLGEAHARFWISDFIALDNWGNETVGFIDNTGAVYTGFRTRFDAELNDRSAQEQITDTCRAGRFGLPFPYQGKLRAVALKREEIDNATIPTFMDYGPDRNIVTDEDGKPILKWSMISDAELANRIILTYEDQMQNYAEIQLPFESVEQQLRAGEASGDTSRRVVEKKFSAFGIINFHEAARLGNYLLHLGEFDEGGISNNFRVEFDTWFSFAIGLHKYQVIRVLSPTLVNKRTGAQRFEYFRIRKLRRKSDLRVTMSCQAYPQDFYDQMENPLIVPPVFPTPGITDDGGDPRGMPHVIGFQHTEFLFDRIRFELGF
jgi:hypothetical protein